MTTEEPITWRMNQNVKPDESLLKSGNEWKYGRKGWRQVKILDQQQKQLRKEKLAEARQRISEQASSEQRVNNENINESQRVNDDTKELIKEMKKYVELTQQLGKKQEEPQPQPQPKEQPIIEQPRVISNNPIFKKFGIQQ